MKELVLRLIVIVAAILFCSISIGKNVESHWVIKCKGDLNTAVMFKKGKVPKEKPADYCEFIVDGSDGYSGGFNPEMDGDGLALLVRGKALSPGKYKVEVKSEETLPKCSDCDAGCWVMDRISKNTHNIDVVVTEKQRFIHIDFKKIPLIKRWQLMGLVVRAKIKGQGIKSEREFVIGLNGWPWCY